MAGSKLKGIVIEIGGNTSKLGKALEDVNKHTRELQSELKGVESLLKMDPGNTELLAQKQQILTEAVAETTKKLETLKNAQEEVQAKWKNYAEAKPQLEAIAKEIADTEKQLKTLQKQQEQATRAFEKGEISEEQYKEITQAVKDTEEHLKALKNEQADLSKKVVNDEQYRDFQREIIATESKLSGLASQLRQTEDEINGVGDAADNSSGDLGDLGEAVQSGSDGFTVMKGALADLVSEGIQKALDAIGNLIDALFELSEATEEYQTMQAKLIGSAENFNYSLDFASEKYKQFYSYLGDDQMANNAVTNFMALQTSAGSLEKVMDSSIAVWTAYGDSIPIESLSESITETAQVGKVTGNLADALNWAGISEDFFNSQLEKCANTEERVNLIASTLNNTYGESKTIYDSLNGSILEHNRAEQELKHTQMQLGEAMRPVNTALTELKTQILVAITPLVIALAEAFLNLLTWLKEHPTVIYVIIGAVTALAVAFGVLAVAMAIQGIISAVSAAFSGLNLVMAALPAVLVAGLVAAIVASLIWLWNNCEAFRNFWIEMWEDLKTIVSSFLTFIVELPGKIADIIEDALQVVIDWGAEMIDSAISTGTQFVESLISQAQQLPGKFISAIQGTVSNVVQWGYNLISAAGSAITNMINHIIGIARQLPSMFVSIGQQIVNGIAQGFASMVGYLYNMVVSALNSLVSMARSVLQIRSPSRRFEKEVGGEIPAGVASGIEKNMGVAEDSVEEMADTLVQKAEVSMNGATLERKLSATFTTEDSSLSPDFSVLAGKLDNIYERLTRLQIVLDTGTLVGETIEKIDAGLATKQRLATRGA